MTEASAFLPDRPARRHPAAVVEDATNEIVRRVLCRVGWREGVLPYLGYGAAPGVDGLHGDAGWVRVLARVLMTRHRGPGRPIPDRRGWRAFVTAHAAGASVGVELGGRRHDVTADRAGVVDVVVPASLAPGRHPVRLVVGAGPPVEGAVLVYGEEATTGLVSDVDDTVMVTYLPRPLLAGWNTFVLRETARRRVPGMPDLYTAILRADPGAPVVYLSTGAWNAAPVLSRFLRRHGYPEGPLLLTDWGPTNTGWFRSGREHKDRQLRRLAAEFPGLRWVLVGDDGQHDPDIYGRFAAEHPGRVIVIALRQLSPAEQVLAKGHIGSPSVEPGAGVPVVEGPDGDALLRELLDRGVLPR
jgi:phosphatidate phosphatase APP1